MVKAEAYKILLVVALMTCLVMNFGKALGGNSWEVDKESLIKILGKKRQKEKLTFIISNRTVYFFNK